jgi:hypothetical protein
MAGGAVTEGRAEVEPDMGGPMSACAVTLQKRLDPNRQI